MPHCRFHQWNDQGWLLFHHSSSSEKLHLLFSDQSISSTLHQFLRDVYACFFSEIVFATLWATESALGCIYRLQSYKIISTISINSTEAYFTRFLPFLIQEELLSRFWWQVPCLTLTASVSALKNEGFKNVLCQFVNWTSGWVFCWYKNMNSFMLPPKILMFLQCFEFQNP